MDGIIFPICGNRPEGDHPRAFTVEAELNMHSIVKVFASAFTVTSDGTSYMHKLQVHKLQVISQVTSKKSAVKGKSPILMDSYRVIRNKFNALNVQLKKQHYANRISACKGNMKESWKTINELLNRRSKSSSIDYLKESGTETRNKKDVPNAMNNFFCTIGRDLADKYNLPPTPFYQVNMKLTKIRPSSNSRPLS